MTGDIVQYLYCLLIWIKTNGMMTRTCKNQIIIQNLLTEWRGVDRATYIKHKWEGRKRVQERVSIV